MSNKHPMIFDPAAYKIDTSHLTTEQHGAYLLLLMTMWTNDGSLPNDEKKLAKIVGSTLKRWHGFCGDVMAFFYTSGDTLRHRRIDHDLDNLKALSEQKANAGRASGRARAKNAKVEAPRGVSRIDSDAAKQLDLLNGAEQPFANARVRVDSTSLREEITGKIQDKKESTTVDSQEEVEIAVQAYSTLAGKIGLPGIRALSDDRQRKLSNILDQYGLPVWNEALAKVETSHFLRGENDRGWVANIDFLLQPSSFLKLIEGRYNDRQPLQHAHSPPPRDEIDELIQREREKEQQNAKH